MLYAETTEHRTLDPAGGHSTIVISVAPVCSADCMELGTTLQISINLYFLLVVFLYLCICIIVQFEPYFYNLKRRFFLWKQKSLVMPQLICVCLFFNVNLCIIMLIGV